jgi:hypothetical protein
MKKSVIIFCLVMVGNSSFAQDPTFQDKKLNAAYGQYIQLKDALVASDLARSKKAAADLHKSLATISEAKIVSELTQKLIASADLTAQRKVFSSLSNEMSTLVKAGKLSAGTLYLEYCPMANNNEGAYWLSNEKAIKNPYFGDKMLTCGSVKETIQ